MRLAPYSTSAHARGALFLLVLLFVVPPLSAADYYVAPKGSDSNPGSIDLPWKTVQKAANSMVAGDTVYLRKGIYKELVAVGISGNDGAPIAFRNYPGEKAVLDAAGKVPGPDRAGIFLIVGRSNIVLAGLVLKNFSTRNKDLTPAGVWIEGGCRNITVENCNISNIANSAVDGNAFGIVAYGTLAAQAISGLKLSGNELSKLKTGTSESVALNGNIDGFEVSGNYIHDCNNIGVDFIGLEGTCPDPLLDRARNGVCRANIIRKISTRSNASYGGEMSAGGIYCDGSKDILIERNNISFCDIGIELASEAPGGSTTGVVVRDNFIHRCNVTGISLGGYEAGLGSTAGCVVRHNTLCNNDTRRTGTGEISFQHNVSNNVVTHNVVSSGGAGLMLGSQAAVGAGNILSYNLYFTRFGDDAAYWEWGAQSFDGRAAWEAAGHESDLLFADPLLVKPTTGNLRIGAGSPAIDSGDPNFFPAQNETDIDGNARISNGRIDRGASEFAP